MNASAAALSDRNISYTGRPREVNSHGPAALEDWEAELWKRAEQRLREFYLLQKDWDGAGAVAPSFEALAATRDYLRNLYSGGAIPPTALSPSPLGSIVLEWRLGDLYVEAEISGTNVIGWMKRKPDGSFEVWYW